MFLVLSPFSIFGGGNSFMAPCCVQWRNMDPMLQQRRKWFSQVSAPLGFPQGDWGTCSNVWMPSTISMLGWRYSFSEYLTKFLNLNSLSYSLAYSSFCKNRQLVCLPCCFSTLSFTDNLQAEDTPRGAAAEKNCVPRSKVVEKEVMYLFYNYFITKWYNYFIKVL